MHKISNPVPAGPRIAGTLQGLTAISTDEKSVANKHCNVIVTKFAVGITESQERLPTFYWLPKFHKRHYKARFM